jgi:dihydroxy-acid dehydratase
MTVPVTGRSPDPPRGDPGSGVVRSGLDLRSRGWFRGDDEVALLHRVAMRSAGIEVDAGHDRPVIGIADSSSDLNPCNLPLRPLVDDVRAGVVAAGGIAVAFGVMSLGEDLMKPSAMLYRNLLSMEVEEYLRSYPLDGVVLLANCDKSVPGAVMGAVSADLPTVVLTGGSRPPSVFRGRRVGTGTDLWRAWDDHRSGAMDDEAWAEFEQCLACGQGACNTMGTASSLALLVEMLGLALPGTATIPSGEVARREAAVAAGRQAVESVRAGLVPSRILTDAAFRNGCRVLHAVGGSTNAVLHLLALAGRAGAAFTLDDVGRLGRDVPVLADVEPSGVYLMPDLHAAGGLPALLRELDGPHGPVELDALAATGRTWAQELAAAVPPPQAPGTPRSPALRPATDPIRTGGAFAVVRGSLAPDGALLKTSAATPALFRHRGPAVVFDGYHDLRARIDDPTLQITPETVLVLRAAGPVGVPGMPEWGMIPIPARLAAAGVRDMVRVTDARMSGTSFGTCFLHVAPESAVGGPLALVHDGDAVEVDVAAGRLDLDVPDDELAGRRAAWRRPPSPHLRGWPALYQAHVLQADTGCDLDFLRAGTPAHRRRVEPVIGRS